jgi:hypothetical protein
MEQRLSLITLGVVNLERSKSFYEALGWRGQEVERTVFFQAGGIAIVLWSREQLAADAGVTDAGADFGGIVLAHNVRSKHEVDQTLALATTAGGEVTQTARHTAYGGYAGYFRDPDGHIWEVAFNPGFSLDENGNLTIPRLQ